MTHNDLIDVITSDHRAVEAAFHELETDGANQARLRRALVDHVIAELVRHSVAQELFMYPVVREVVPDGDRIADREISENAEAERLMDELDGMDVTDSRFAPKLQELMRDIRHHVEIEETDLLPKLAMRCTATQLQDIGDNMLWAKSVAPSRPHPCTPDQPPTNMLIDPSLGLVDKIRDAFSGRSR